MAWRTDGFTLIELMIVVAIIGTLSSIAIPTFKGYKARALESEWYANLKAIYVGASAYFQTPHAGTATDDGDLGNCLPHSRRSGNHGGNGAIYALNVMAPPVVIAVALGESLPMTFDWTSLLIGVRNGQLYKRELVEAPNH